MEKEELKAAILARAKECGLDIRFSEKRGVASGYWNAPEETRRFAFESFRKHGTNAEFHYFLEYMRWWNQASSVIEGVFDKLLASTNANAKLMIRPWNFCARASIFTHRVEFGKRSGELDSKVHVGLYEFISRFFHSFYGESVDSPTFEQIAIAVLSHEFGHHFSSSEFSQPLKSLQLQAKSVSEEQFVSLGSAIVIQCEEAAWEHAERFNFPFPVDWELFFQTKEKSLASYRNGGASHKMKLAWRLINKREHSTENAS